MSFENQLQQWVQLDNQLRQLNERTKELREKRNTLERNLTQYATSNGLSNATVKIGSGDDKLKFSNTKVAEPLTFKYLEKVLTEVIKNETQLKIIMDHIKQKREIKVMPEIKRFSAN